MFGTEAAEPAEMRELNEVWVSMGDIRSEYLTCRNHPTARYVTKNPWTRGIHFVTPPAEAEDPQWRAEHGSGPANLECDCPFADLVVVP